MNLNPYNIQWSFIEFIKIPNKQIKNKLYKHGFSSFGKKLFIRHSGQKNILVDETHNVINYLREKKIVGMQFFITDKQFSMIEISYNKSKPKFNNYLQIDDNNRNIYIPITDKQSNERIIF